MGGCVFFQVLLSSRTKKKRGDAIASKVLAEPAARTATQAWTRERGALFGVCKRSNTLGLGLLPARHTLSFRLLPAGFAVWWC